MNRIDFIEQSDMKTTLPRLEPGDTVRVHVRVKETSVKEEIKGKPKETERERVQIFEGLIIGLKGSGTRATMTVRKVSFGEGVERIFPLHAKTIEKIEVVKQARGVQGLIDLALRAGLAGLPANTGAPFTASAVDFVTTGEFDYPIQEIAQGRPFAEVDGIAFRLQDGTVFRTPTRPPIHDLLQQRADAVAH
jgi:large subunit ribosomal protein L19